MHVSKIVSTVKDLYSEAGPKAEPPLRKVAVTPVCANPCAGRYVDDPSVLISGSREVRVRIPRIAADLMKPYAI